jgi:hypothetical protein
MAEKGMKTRKRHASNPDVLGAQLCKAGSARRVYTVEADTAIRTILRACEGGERGGGA